ncbi:MAG: DUF4105 domain-containing protein [Spirochaetaceae bacterium]|nr:DUF4105 domain-containing protein [Spirochaetaceae bacterium]
MAPERGVFCEDDGSSANQPKSRFDLITIKAAVIGPGDDFFSWWGHLGIICDDAFTGESRFYDYGVFSFDEENFFSNLIAGNWYYSMTVRDAKYDIGWYINNNRDVVYYTLNLSAAQKKKMLDFLEWNALPQNRRYYYKIFTDNCVTRPLLLLDDVLDGAFLSRYNNEKGRFTVREHANRHLYPSQVMYWILNFVMGAGIDAESSRTDEMYLPQEFAGGLEDFTVEKDDGSKERLVSNVEVINISSGRNLALDAPPSYFAQTAAAGMFLAVLFLIFNYLYAIKKIKWAFIAFYACCAVFSFVFGVLGTTLCYASFFSNHIYTYNNINVIFVNPVFLAACVMSLIAIFTKNKKRSLAARKAVAVIYAFVFIAASFAAVLTMFPPFFQDSRLAILLIAPPAAALGLSGRPPKVFQAVGRALKSRFKGV